jgi:predicted acetyltransferase
MAEPEPEVRIVTADEREAVIRVVGHAMLLGASDESVAAWAERHPPDRTHGAFVDGRLVGTARWFPTRLSTPGGSLQAGAVSGVGVLPTHRRQGHLRRLMDAQLDHMAAEGHAVAVLVSAEWPIYARYGYGPAVDACGWEVDTATAAFTDPPEGAVELLDRPTEARSDLERVHDVMAETRPGVITRDEILWDIVTRVRPMPGTEEHRSKERAARWRDAEGQVQGVVLYRVEQRWDRNRPRSTAHVTELFATSPTAERELWRHVCSIDWVSQVKAGRRPVDDLLPMWLTDGRAAVQVDRFDHVWVRLLDVPAALAGRAAGGDAEVVVEVADPGGRSGGRWRVHGEVGSPIEASPTDDPAEVALPLPVLGAAYLGGRRSLRQWHQAGHATEHAEGAIARLDSLLRSDRAPWCPTDF